MKIVVSCPYFLENNNNNENNNNAKNPSQKTSNILPLQCPPVLTFFLQACQILRTNVRIDRCIYAYLCMHTEQLHSTSLRVVHPSTQSPTHRPANADPNLYAPKRANALRATGTGFCRRIARGRDEPARTSEARSPASMPYGWRARMRRPEKVYFFEYQRLELKRSGNWIGIRYDVGFK